MESRYRDSTIDVHHRVDSPVRPSEESGQCLRDDLAGLVLHPGQVVGVDEGLRIDLVLVLRAGGAGREPRVFGDDLDTPMAAPLPGASVSTRCTFSPATSLTLTSSPESFLSRAFCSRVASESTRA